MLQIDKADLSRWVTKCESANAASHAKIVAAINHGALNVKNAIREDVKTSKFKQFRRISTRYEMKDHGTVIEAAIHPTDTGPSDLSNLAFFGTSKGGGTHKFYEHGVDEWETTSNYVRRALEEAWQFL